MAAAHPADETPRRGGTLHLASFADIATLDPPLASDLFTSSVLRLVYAGLVDFDADGHVVPDLAARVDEADEGRTYRFTLRENVRFHDGAELTADGREALDRARSRAHDAVAVASFYGSIDGLRRPSPARKAPRTSDGVVVEGRYVVTIHLARARRDVPPGAGDGRAPRDVPERRRQVLAVVGCVRRGAISSAARWMGARANADARPQRRATSARGSPTSTAVTLGARSIVHAEGLKFARGELDMVRDLTQPETVRYQADERWKPFGALEKMHGMQGESMNTEIPPFDNVEVRRAVASAIDRDHIVMLKSSNLTALTKPVPRRAPRLRARRAKGQRYDYAAALLHMKKAGYAFDPATGRGGWPAPIVYDVAKQSMQEVTAQSMQQDLAKIGLRVELRMSSLSTLYSITHRRGKSQMSPQGWQEDFPDPSDFLDPLFSSKAINDEDSTNYAFYANAALDALLERARRERRPGERDAPLCRRRANRLRRRAVGVRVRLSLLPRAPTVRARVPGAPGVGGGREPRVARSRRGGARARRRARRSRAEARRIA